MSFNISAFSRLVAAALLISASHGALRSQAVQIGLIGFYNVENLFDTLDTPDVNDYEFTPNGPNAWGSARYYEKLDHMAQVIGEMGTDLTPDGPAIIGLAEIENRAVLEDFAAHPGVKRRNYQVAHFDSPDRRGVDVGLLYNPRYFKLTESKAVPLMIYDAQDGDRIYTRDVLVVGGYFMGDLLYVLVNHWPSRRGGEAASQPLRNAGALLCKNICDTLRQQHPEAKFVIMGDLNDDPISPSVLQVLNAKGKASQVEAGGFFNPMYEMFRRGLGTLAYRDSWNLFDQIIVSDLLLPQSQPGIRFHQAHIFNPPYLYQQSGQFKGYPFRTYVGSNYAGGYSDHFPVYISLVKPAK